jgi:hypothetical protein
MNDRAIRMRQFPGAKRVCPKTGVYEDKTGHHPFIRKLGIVKLQLLASEQPFVNDLSPIKRTDVKEIRSADTRMLHSFFDHTPQHVKSGVQLLRSQGF